MKRISLIFALLLICAGAFAQSFTTVIDGVERSYTIHLPKNLKKNAPYFS